MTPRIARADGGWRDAARSGLAGSADSVQLFGAKLVAALAGFTGNLILARTLGHVEYGRYAFALGALTFLSQFFDLGLFTSGARLLTVARTEDERRGYFGAMLVMGGGLSAGLIVLVFAGSRVVDRVLPDKIGHLLATVAVLTPSLATPFLVEQALKASGRTALLSMWTGLTRVLFAVSAGVLALAGNATAVSATIVNLATGLVATAVVFIRLRPRLTGLEPFLKRIGVEQRRFGMKVYVGKVLNLASYNSDKLLLAYFVNATTVGFYSLAMSMGSGVVMFSQSVATASFAGFADRQPIRRQLLWFNLGGIAAVAVATVLTGWGVVHAVLGMEYAPVLVLLPVATLAAAFQGAYQPYNSWLLANGFGDELRQFLIWVAGINLGMNLLLIPLAGGMGAAIASSIGTAAYLVLAVRACRTAVVKAA